MTKFIWEDSTYEVEPLYGPIGLTRNRLRPKSVELTREDLQSMTEKLSAAQLYVFVKRLENALR
jgi:hypothetical protein